LVYSYVMPPICLLKLTLYKCII